MPKTKKSRVTSIKNINETLQQAKPVRATHKPKRGSRTKVFTVTGADGRKYELTAKQKLFCELFVKFDFKGIEAVIDSGYSVFDEKTGKPNRIVASKIARENLLKQSIQAYNDILFERAGYNEISADKQLLKVMNQDTDLSSKTRAVDIYFKKIGAYAPEKHEHSVNEELEEALERIAKLLPK